MGILRYFLAIVVVFCHAQVSIFSKPFDGNGGIAVQAFFVISGFYMAMIVDKYQLKNLKLVDIKNFYLSRFLRILPLYYLCLLITLILYYLHLISLVHAPMDVLNQLHYSRDKSIYLFENLFIFGQSLMRFFVYDPTLHTFVLPSIHSVAPPAEQMGSSFAVLGQAWSLSIELTFYLMVPFILTRSNLLIFTVCFTSFFLRTAIYFYTKSVEGLGSDIFFPIAIGLFLLGSLSHNVFYSSIRNSSRKYLNTMMGVICLCCIFLYGIVFYHRIGNYNLKCWLFIMLVVFSLPYLFNLSKNIKMDRSIGELSYPVYMTHFFCLALITHYLNSSYIAYYTIVLSTIISIFIDWFLIKPLEKYRHEKFLHHKTRQIESKILPETKNIYPSHLQNEPVLLENQILSR